jgi:hypothetical protein
LSRSWRVANRSFSLVFLIVATTISSALLVGNTVSASAAPTSTTVRGIDLHDGTIQKFGSTYYMYGTKYGCGFQWYVANTPWCGFGVAKSSDMVHWSTPTALFSPSEIDPYSRLTWTNECGASGRGCFNPRMIRRSGWGANDGVYVLWFNSPEDYARNGANAYNVMGCNGPAGPCGPKAGAPNGSYHKPSLYICSGNGDFTIYSEPGQTVMFCTMPGTSELRSEKLDKWGANGVNVGQRKLAGLSKIESPGVFRDSASGRYLLTFSDPSCGYCPGTASGYATGSSALGSFTVHGAMRRDFDPNSCGGQPRTVFTIDGVHYGWIDLWLGARNETKANIQLEPLTYSPNTSQYGQPWTAEIRHYVC